MNEQEERVLHLVGEDVGCRGENQKQFRREDGMRARIVYDHPVHFEGSGKWESIDNTLKREKDADGDAVYRNTTSSLGITLAASMSEKKLASLTYRDRTLRWEISGAAESKGTEVVPEEEKDHDQALIHPKELFSSI